MTDIGKRHTNPHPISQPHQAHQMARLFLPSAQPNESIELLTVPRDDMGNGMRWVFSRAAHPPELSICPCLEKREAELSEVEEEHTARREPLEDIAQIHAAVFVNVLAPLQPCPSLSAQIKETNQLSGKASWLMRAYTAQRLEIPSDGIPERFIERENSVGTQSESCRYRPRTSLGQSGIEPLPPFLQGRQTCLEKPFDHIIPCEPDEGKRAELLPTQETTPICKCVHSWQCAEQQTAPQVGPADLLRTPAPMNRNSFQCIHVPLRGQATSLPPHVTRTSETD